jgi:hypothetical protein
MKTKLIGMITSIALLGSGAALAGGDWKQHDKQQQTQSQGTEARQGSTQKLGSNEIIGRVVKSSKKMVWVEHAGAIVPLTINKQTQFNDPNLKRAQDFQEGDQVRASFEVRKTDNIATSIQKSDSSMGGSGSTMPAPDATHTDPNSLPPSRIDDGTGGSGTSDLTPPDIRDEGNSSNLGSDSSKGEGDY